MTTPTGFIREIDAYTGATADQEVFPKLVAEQLQHQNLCPPKLIVDRAGGAGKTRARIAEITHGQTQVVAHTMPYDERSERFVPDDFSLSADDKTLTCPFGQSTALVYRHGNGDGRQFRFHHLLCQACPFNPHTNPACLDPQVELPFPLPPSGHRICRHPEAKPDTWRQVFISHYRHILEDARAYNQTDAFQRDIKLRPPVERVLSELTRYNGARRAACQGVQKADFQSKMCATAQNLKLWGRLVMRQERRSQPLLAWS